MNKIPKEFRAFVLRFDPRSLQSPADLESWIASYVLSFNASQREVIKSYLGTLLASEAVDIELETIWLIDSPTFGVSSGGYRAFLQFIRDRI
jgi:hypothetical protein